jgi:hypothetical protein
MGEVRVAWALPWGVLVSYVATVSACPHPPEAESANSAIKIVGQLAFNRRREHTSADHAGCSDLQPEDYKELRGGCEDDGAGNWGRAGRPAAREIATASVRSRLRIKSSDIDRLFPLRENAGRAVKEIGLPPALSRYLHRGPGRAVVPPADRTSGGFLGIQTGPAWRGPIIGRSVRSD